MHIYTNKEEKKEVMEMPKNQDYFNKNGRRFYIIRTFADIEFAQEKLAERKKLAPQFLWTMKRITDGSYAIGRCNRK